MIFIKLTNKEYLFKRIRAITFPFPFVFYSKVLAAYHKRHESIHNRQFMEIAFISLVILNTLISFEVLNSYYWLLAAYPIYYIVYLLEMLIKRFIYGNWNLAYRNISFEREAYSNQNDTAYLSNRLPFSFLNYIVDKEKK